MGDSFAGNRVTGHTGSRFPIIQAPMAWVARAQLVSAVSRAGGFGLLESASRDVSAIAQQIDAVRAITDCPFGVNLAIRYLRSDEAVERSMLDLVTGSGVRFVTTSAGDPHLYIRRLHDTGITVYHSVPSLEGACKAEDAGVDGLIVEGAESAGIRGREPVHSLVLLQAVRERVALPIVAAGGIADGRGMAAAFALGAEGVAMGTRFVASVESPVHRHYKGAIVGASSTGTLTLPIPPGATSRVLKTELALRYAAGDADGPRPSRNIIQDLYIDGRLDVAMGSAGETVALINSVKPVADIIDDTVRGFWRELDRLAALRPKID